MAFEAKINFLRDIRIEKENELLVLAKLITE